MENKQDLTTGSVRKKLVLFFLPILMGLLFQQLYNAADAFIVGRYVGDSALAAVGGSVASITNLIIGFFTGLNTGATVLIAQKYGARDDQALSRVLHTAIVFCCLTGIVITLVVLALAPAVLRLLNTPEDILEDSVTYLRIYCGGAIFLLLYNLFQGTLQAIGDSRRPLIYLVISCFVNIALDLLTVAVLKMGVAGAAWASVTSMALCTVMAGSHLIRSKGPQTVRFSKLCLDRSVLANILKIGLPSGVQGALYAISNVIVMTAVNGFGTGIVTAWTATGKVDGFYWAASNAFGVALCSFVGQCYGAGKLDRMREAIKVWLRISMIATLGIVAVILLFCRRAYGLFLSDPRTIDDAVAICTYFVPFYPAWTVVEIMSGSFRGVGDAFRPMLIVMLGTCVFRILWVLAIFPMWHTVPGLSLVYAASWIVTAAAMIVYYRKGIWLKNGKQTVGESGDSVTSNL